MNDNSAGEMMLTNTPYATTRSYNAALHSPKDTEASRTFAHSEATSMPLPRSQAVQDQFRPHADDRAHNASSEEGSGHIQDTHSAPSPQVAGDETPLRDVNVPVESGGLQVSWFFYLLCYVSGVS